MSRLHGFPPAGSASPRVLILGSFPSVASLEKGEYYGHGRNHFWQLLGSILGFDPALGYLERLSRLEVAGIALWDLLASCEREGSLDQDIRGEEPNGLAAYLEAAPGLHRLALNGGKAAASFLAHVAPELRAAGGGRGRGSPGLAIGEARAWLPPFAEGRSILVERLPSSSPVPTAAYRSAADKLPLWAAYLSP